MSTKYTKLKVSRAAQKKLEQLSPFEMKNTLISLAKENAQNSTKAMLNAGRGNPNWIATTPRQAFFTLGDFAIKESKRVWEEKDLGGMPQKEGIATRLTQYIDKHSKDEGAIF